MTTTTDTPRTDAAWNTYGDDYELELFARQLERELTASKAEVERLRKYVELIEVYAPENEWSQPEWRKLIGSKEENEDPETLFQLYQFRLAAATEESVTQKGSPNKETPLGTTLRSEGMCLLAIKT